MKRIEASDRRTHGGVRAIISNLFEEFSQRETALNMLRMASERLAVAASLGNRQFALIAPSMLCDSAVSFACALLRVCGVAIESDTDPHAELCDRFSNLSELEYLDAERLMRDIDDYGTWLGNQKMSWGLAGRSLGFMASAAVVLQTELPEAPWDTFDKLLRAVRQQLARALGRKDEQVRTPDSE